jgi:hypothetical protein
MQYRFIVIFWPHLDHHKYDWIEFYPKLWSICKVTEKKLFRKLRFLWISDNLSSWSLGIWCQFCDLWQFFSIDGKCWELFCWLSKKWWEFFFFFLNQEPLETFLIFPRDLIIIFPFHFDVKENSFQTWR